MKMYLRLSTLRLIAFVAVCLLSTSIISAQKYETFSPAVSTGVVINEVYGGSESGGVFNADFIELHNLSAFPVNISDWSIQYYTPGQINGGAPTSTASIPDATILAPGALYVIQVSPSDRPGLPLTCVNFNAAATFAETGIAADGGKIVLTSTSADLPDCNSSLNVIDRLGYGTTPVLCNETENATVLSASTSVQRRAFGVDTDNNSVDFTGVHTPTPCREFFAPTAAMVVVGGRVTGANGQGLSRVAVSYSNATGLHRNAITSAFGYYAFENVSAGESAVISVSSKRYEFIESAYVITATEDLVGVNFVAK